jgi:hypothetical protein
VFAVVENGCVSSATLSMTAIVLEWLSAHSQPKVIILGLAGPGDTCSGRRDAGMVRVTILAVERYR